MLNIGTDVTITHPDFNGEQGIVAGAQFTLGGVFEVQCVRRSGTVDLLLLRPGVEFVARG